MSLVYTWTVFASFWKLPSWLFFLKSTEIISIYAYAFLVNFVESILLLCVALLPGIVLPRRWWVDVLISRGFVLILVILGSAVLHMMLFRTPDTRATFVNSQPVWWIVTILIAIILTWVAGRVALVREALENMADRLIIFLYIYLPLTAFALLIVLVRIYG
jgi:hypothetical protein